jgi:hypothetical protein
MTIGGGVVSVLMEEGFIVEHNWGEVGWVFLSCQQSIFDRPAPIKCVRNVLNPALVSTLLQEAVWRIPVLLR